MNKSIIAKIGIGTPSAILSILGIINHPSVQPLVDALNTMISLPLGIIILILGGTFFAGIFLLKQRKNSVYPSNYTYEREKILNHLEEQYGAGFDYDDASVVEATQKGRQTIKDVSIFINRSEKQTQKIINKLATKGVQGFQKSNP